jgi:hypothetical protein
LTLEKAVESIKEVYRDLKASQEDLGPWYEMATKKLNLVYEKSDDLKEFNEEKNNYYAGEKLSTNSLSGFRQSRRTSAIAIIEKLLHDKERQLSLLQTSRRIPIIESFKNIYSNAWTIIVTLLIAFVGGAYILGKDMGGANMERANDRLESQNQNLKEKISHQSDTMHLLDSTLSKQKQMLDIYYQLLPPRTKDSLRKLNY